MKERNKSYKKTPLFSEWGFSYKNSFEKFKHNIPIHHLVDVVAVGVVYELNSS